MTQPAQQNKPAILTVDDDPGVSRAVARDLRRRYGEKYRIIRAESGASAIDALKASVPIWKHERYVGGDAGWLHPESPRGGDA